MMSGRNLRGQKSVRSAEGEEVKHQQEEEEGLTGWTVLLRVSVQDV